jgi:hypothetical protein
MSNNPMPWIKYKTALLHDVRLAAVDEREQLRYFQLYLLAGQLNEDGAFLQDKKKLSVKQIAFLLRVKDVKQLEKDIVVLKKAGLLKANGHGPYIADFKDEQIRWIDKQREDRERQRKKRQADASQGSHRPVTRDSQGGHAPRPESRPESKTRVQKREDQPPYPPSTGDDSPLGGGVGSKRKASYLDGPEFKTITKKLRAELARIEKVLSLSGLGNLKLKNTLNLLAIRSFPKNNRTQFVMAALASAYSDAGANNKAIVTAHRIEKDRVPSEYLSPATWDVIPENIVKAAGNAIDAIEPKSKGDRIRAKVKAIRSRSKE